MPDSSNNHNPEIASRISTSPCNSVQEPNVLKLSILTYGRDRSRNGLPARLARKIGDPTPVSHMMPPEFH